jgi:hypothetical protein
VTTADPVHGVDNRDAGYYTKGYVVRMMAVLPVNGDGWKKERKWKTEIGQVGLSSGEVQGMES